MLDRTAVAAALAKFVTSQDYDLHKEIEADGAEGYSALAATFSGDYEAELSKRAVIPRRLVAGGRVLSLSEFRRLTAAVPGASRLVMELYGPAGDRERAGYAGAARIAVDGDVALEAGAPKES